jgi:dihydrolipoamide dehydrogenase
VQSFDVIVIGAGPAGEVAAGRLGGGGLDVAIVERELVGGECSYWGCMPSKGLLRPAEILAEVRRVPGAAEAVTGSIDVTTVLRRRDEIIHDLDDSSQLPWLEKNNVKLLRGEARVTGERTVEIDGETYEARKAVVLATGTRAGIPPVEGLKEVGPWTNRELTTTKHAPESLIIIGGGVIGVEMAQAWSSLHTKVALVEVAPRLLMREEPFAAQQVEEALVENGVDVHTDVKIGRVERHAGLVAVTLGDGTILTGEEIAVTAGRTSNTEAVEPLGYEPGKPVEVDEYFCTKDHPEWLHAIGDVNGNVLLTHMGKYQASIVADRILGLETHPQHQASGPQSPRVIFTDPQVAAVGHTEQTARDANLDIKIVEVETSGNAGGSFYGRNAPGTARMIVDEDRKVICGATVTGSEVADFIHPFTIAIVGEVPMDRLWHAVPCFPTRSELWLRLLESYRQ